MFNRLIIVISALGLVFVTGCGKKTEATKPAVAEKAAPVAKKSSDKVKPRVFFVSPKDGAKVGTEVEVEFGLEGMSISPAGENIKDKTKGHHHLIIDAAPIPYGGMVPMDEKHKHFGKGQTKTKIKLMPGKHTLTMQFADGAHKSFGKALSATITVEAVGPIPKAEPTSAPTSAPTSQPAAK
jgi:hypothetical protein